MTAQKIRTDYDSLAEISQGFAHEAGRTRRTLDQLHKDLDVLLDGDWVGKGATPFYQEMISNVLPSLKRLGDALEQAARTAQEMSRIMKQAETDSARLFVLHGSGGAPAGAAAGGETAQGGAGGPRKSQERRRGETTHEEQVASLTRLGVVVPEGAEFTLEEGQAVIDFYEANPGLLESGMTFSDAQRAIEIVERAEGAGFGVGLSSFNSKPWSLSDLERLDNAVDSASQTMHDQFVAQFADPAAAEAALAQIATQLNVSVEDAALRLFIHPADGVAFRFLRDAGVNVAFVDGDNVDDTVGYTGHDNEVYVRAEVRYEDPPGSGTFKNYTVVYDPTDYDIYTTSGAVPADLDANDVVAESFRDDVDGNKLRNARFYGWYSGVDVILADSVLMMEGTATNFAITGEFSAEALILHEVGHAVDNAHQSVALDATTEGLTYHAGTSVAADELQADIIMNGMLGDITSATQQENFDSYVETVFADNFASLTDSSIADFEEDFAAPEATPEATDSP